ncbi:MAG TPA: hypothetical protein VJQ52_03875 [Steroidobacteraceae bacterium]|nr:hypothetical protein [Steroidobacteraceae bacterium]
MTGIANCGSRICPWRYKRSVSQIEPPVFCGGVFWKRPSMSSGERCMRASRSPSKRPPKAGSWKMP